MEGGGGADGSTCLSMQPRFSYWIRQLFDTSDGIHKDKKVGDGIHKDKKVDYDQLYLLLEE